MKKLFLIGLLGLVLFSGCFDWDAAYNDDTGVKDCGTDLDCFNKSIKVCEKAKVKYTESVYLGPQTGIEVYTTENTEAKIVNHATLCFVRFTNLKAVYTTGSKEEKNWTYGNCQYKIVNPEIEFLSCFGSTKKLN